MEGILNKLGIEYKEVKMGEIVTTEPKNKIEHIDELKNECYLSTILSEVGNTTIEKYIILRKINKAKGLIIFDELNFAEISYELGYSSPAHFSNQFKTITGYSPLQFKKMVKHTENQKIM